MEETAYDHRKIEAKWQEYWRKNKTFRASEDPDKPKYYVLDMFPFPSGSGLHVGHPVGYTATDIVARYKRQKGFSVLHPMGWDSFGLPAEQYAVKTGAHPAVTTQQNIDNFRRQLLKIGLSYDWDREFATSDASYYRWSQWIFTLLYQKGLAYEAEMLVNYCPALGTVLANEEIDNGRSKVGGHPVVRKPLKQWVLKITAYAERLLADLEGLDWPEGLKKLQSNWIGRSEGAYVDFKLSDGVVTVFTTCPDTLFGATFLVLAPEHPLVDQLTTKEQRGFVESYRAQVAAKSDLERGELNKEKSGVWTGGYAVNPASGAKVPVWIADYVLMGYGTGAIMAVPGHDSRDLEFAQKFSLPVKAVYETVDGVERMIESQSDSLTLNGLEMAPAKQAIIDWLEKAGYGRRAVTYKLRDWLFSRQRYWGEPIPILHFEDGSTRALALDELPLLLPEVSSYQPSAEGLSPLAKLHDWVDIVDEASGQKARRETNTMPNWAGSCWYYLRFCDPHNAKQAWNEGKEAYWMPVDLYIGGVEHAVLHLLYARFWHKVLFDCGLVSTSEPFKALRNQGLISARSYLNDSGNYVDSSQVEEREGRYFLRTTQEELRSQIEKMSKSKLNGVSPDEIIEEFGADALRVYLMFLGPLEKEKIWKTDAVNGPRRFLSRFYELFTSPKVTDVESKEALKLGYRLLHSVSNDIEQLLFNTAIAKMMTFVNEFSRLPAYPRSVLKMAAQALAPFAPHLAEEAWQILGGQQSISAMPYPEIPASYLVDEMVTYVVQVNGKVRGTFELPKAQTKEAIMELATSHPQISKHLTGNIDKLIFVPDKLLNFVVKE